MRPRSAPDDRTPAKRHVSSPRLSRPRCMYSGCVRFATREGDLLRRECPDQIRAMPILIRYAPSSLTREQYDKVNEILQENGPEGPPPALQLHVMFGEGSDLRVSEIWESEDAWQQAWPAASRPRCPQPALSFPSPTSSRSTRSGEAAWRTHSSTSRFVKRCAASRPALQTRLCLGGIAITRG